MRPWSSTNDLNVRPLVPKTSALPTAPVLDNKYIITFYLTKSQIKIINQIADRAAIYSAGLYRDKSLTNPFTFRRGTFCLPYGSRPQLSYSKEKGNNTNNERRRYTILAIKLFSISKSRKHHEQVENNSFPWWRLGGSNPWPTACKAVALPAELNPRGAAYRNRTYNIRFTRAVLYQLS